MQKRIILHIDVNNAFLSWTAVDMLKNGSKIDIRNKYAVIGGDEESRRGVVLAKSNLCKQRGVVTGESLYMARRKCPGLKVFPANHELYEKESDKLYEYLKDDMQIILELKDKLGDKYNVFITNIAIVDNSI